MNILIARHGWVNYALGVLWSLSVEEVFYLVFPLACLVLKSERRLLVFMALIIVVRPVYRFAHSGDEGAIPVKLLGLLRQYRNRLLCCDLFQTRRVRMAESPYRIGRARTIHGGVISGLADRAEQGARLHGHGCRDGAMLAAAQCKPARGTTVARRGLAACGRLRYELYLFHLIVLGLMRAGFPPKTISGGGKMVLLPAYFMIWAALAQAISRAFSAPMNRIIGGNSHS